jgi:Spy/CpxP family protein refolding chaperone
MASAMVVRLDRELHLTDEQKRQLRTILEAWDARVRAAQDDVQQQFREDQQQLRQDVIKVLTPEQAARFDEIGGRALAVPVGRGGRGPLGRGRGGPGRE